MDVSCIAESGCYCLFIPLFFIFLSLQFSNDKKFCHIFSGTVRPKMLKLYTNMGNEWMMYRVYQNQTAAMYVPHFFHFSFSPIFKHFKFSSYFSQEL